MTTNKLTLITPTSDRPVAFELCERWMRRAMEQFDGEVQWIVSDDGTAPVTCTLGQEHVRRPHVGDRKKSFLGNVGAALERIRYEKVLFIEDDDWYAVDYLTKMSRWLDEAEIVGEGRAHYYHVPTRRYRLCPNGDHASLCQTGIRGELISWMAEHIAQHKSTFIDVHVWKTGAKECKRLLKPQTSLSVGIKGLPGTKGIGVGHRLGEGSRHDADGSILRSWMNPNDAAVYFDLAAQSEPAVPKATPIRAPLETGLAILTYVPSGAHPDVRSRLPEAIRTLESSGYDGPVSVIDDGSNDEQHCEFLESLSRKYNVFRRDQNGGICLAKNTCIRVLMELGVDVGFIAEDDIAFRPGWFELYRQAHAAIPEIHHYSWAWDGYPSGYMRKTPRKIHGHTIVQTSRLNGMFLTFTPRVVEEVGGFKPMPGKWGHTHTNWTRRIIKAGLAPYFVDVLRSNDYLTVNQFSSQSSVSHQLKSRGRRTNDRPARDLSQLFFPIAE